MTQLVFIHGPGAGACGEGFAYQLEHFPGSLAPTLPGHLSGVACTSVERYTDWLRGWRHPSSGGASYVSRQYPGDGLSLSRVRLPIHISRHGPVALAHVSRRVNGLRPFRAIPF